MKARKTDGLRTPREKAIVPPGETEGLRFRETQQVSVYRDLLEDLQDAPKGSTLKISRQARYTVVKHIRDLGLKVLWARKGDWLYVKIIGEAEQPLTIERVVREAAVEKVPVSPPGPAPKRALVETMILATLAQGPMTLKELARTVGATPTSLAETLSRMVGHKQIENEGGVYRRLAA